MPKALFSEDQRNARVWSMAKGQDGLVLRSIQTLFGAGTAGGMSDAELLERFVSRQDDTAQAAFEALVHRHGPMVFDVCRSVLRAPDDAQDAFQATFLILARKASSIRRREALGSWLFGVARRVATKARTAAARRRSREREAAQRVPALDAGPKEWLDRAVLHEEIDRLPEKYRVPVVLCYLEGMTYENAALRLQCPLGTVSIRLKRARERLRDRLTHRGMVAPAGLLLTGLTPSETTAAFPVSLVEATVRMATTEGITKSLHSSSVATLTQGVLRTMYLTKLKVVGVGTALVCLTLFGARALVGQQGAAGPAKRTATPIVREQLAEEREPEEAELLKRLVGAARQREQSQRAFYVEGRLPTDRYLDALNTLMRAEVLAAATPDEKLAAVKAYLERVKGVEAREQAALKAGQGTKADVDEAAMAGLQAEIELRRAQASAGPVTLESLDRRLSAVERKLDTPLHVLPPRKAN